MHHYTAIRRHLKIGSLAAVAAFALVALVPAPASATGVGSDNTMFKRHFWRGQAFHGRGYHPQISDIGRERAFVERDAYEATVID